MPAERIKQSQAFLICLVKGYTLLDCNCQVFS